MEFLVSKETTLPSGYRVGGVTKVRGDETKTRNKRVVWSTRTGGVSVVREAAAPLTDLTHLPLEAAKVGYQPPGFWSPQRALLTQVFTPLLAEADTPEMKEHPARVVQGEISDCQLVVSGLEGTRASTHRCFWKSKEFSRIMSGHHVLPGTLSPWSN